MRVLVIGGTRFIGPCVVRCLLDWGHEVACFTRGKSELVLPKEVEHLTGDRRDVALDILPLRAYEPDAVIDMCCSVERDAKWLVETFAGHTRQLVLVSSMDVYRAYGRLIGTEPGEPDALPIGEDAPLREKLYPYRGAEPRAADDPLAILDDYDKIPCEQAVLAAGSDELAVTVLRLPFVYGPGDYQHRFWSYLAQMTEDNHEILIPSAQAEWRADRGYVKDIARGIVMTVGLQAAAGRVFNICEDEVLSELEFAQKVADAAGWQGTIKVGEPEAANEQAKDAGSEAEAQAARMDWRQHFVVDSSRIRSELSYREALGLPERYARTVAWELANPPEDAGE